MKNETGIDMRGWRGTVIRCVAFAGTLAALPFGFALGWLLKQLHILH